MIIAAALLGLASIPHCMGMCGPIAGACSATRSSSATYQLARLATYTSLGALAATALRPLRESMPSGAWAWVLAIVTSIALLASALRIHRMKARTSELVPLATLRKKTRTPALLPLGLGMLTGLLPCGALYGALAIAATAPSSSEGALAMLTFGLVSSFGLSLSHLAARALQREGAAAGRALVTTALVAGAMIVLVRPLVARDPDVPCHGVTPQAHAQHVEHGAEP